MVHTYIHDFKAIRYYTIFISILSGQVVPHYYLSVDLDLTELLALRERLNGTIKAGSGGRELSVLDFLMKAAALAMKLVGQGTHPDTATSYIHTCT